MLFVLGALMFWWAAPLGAFGGERVVVSPAALWWRRRRWRRPEVVPLDEVTSVVVTGSGADTRVDLQIGRRTIRILDEIGYNEAELRWCVQRMRRALDHARAGRGS